MKKQNPLLSSINKSASWKLYKNTKVDSSNTYHSLKYYSEDNIELIRIALKKEKDRKNKLEKFLVKFQEIEDKQKKNAKQIKASIIELKDVEAAQKMKLLVDPSIFVDNELKIQTREFLCLLLNTFYKTYDEYEKTSKKITEINESLAYLVKQISYAEEMLVVNQKLKIFDEIKLEGELLNERGKLKEILGRRKRIEEEYQGVNEVYLVEKAQHDKKCETNNILQEKLYVLKERLNKLDRNITEQENIRKDCRDQISEELTYQSMFKEQLSDISRKIAEEQKKQKRIQKQLFAYKSKRQAANRSLPLCQSIKHNVKVQMMQSKGQYIFD